VGWKIPVCIFLEWYIRKKSSKLSLLAKQYKLIINPSMDIYLQRHRGSP
jgi:hypothetical protein